LREQRERVAEVVLVANELGLKGISPIVLSDAGNLTVHLAPHPVVGRVATLFPEDDAEMLHDILDRELRVVQHLFRKRLLNII